MLYSFKIYDTHENQSFDSDGSLTIRVFDFWHKFELAISTDDLWITSFREYTLFDDKGNPTPCTKVYLSDGSFVFATNKYDTFYKNYETFLNKTKVEISDTP